jgi:hypothetical protein
MDLITPRHSPRTPRHNLRPRRLSARRPHPSAGPHQGRSRARSTPNPACAPDPPPIQPAQQSRLQSSLRSRAVSNPACAAKPSPTQSAQQSRSPSPTRLRPPSLCTDRRSRNVVPLQPAARSTRRRRGSQRSRAPRRYPDQAQPCSPTCAPRLGAETRSPLAAPTEPSLRPDHVAAPWMAARTRSRSDDRPEAGTPRSGYVCAPRLAAKTWSPLERPPLRQAYTPRTDYVSAPRLGARVVVPIRRRTGSRHTPGGYVSAPRVAAVT